ncbi:hypothetical protein [Clostridium cylindrosporum]|uniref:Putative HD-superfamily hydrolase n=1 Tax=Clostridium cylindrosporum DSM 605 TaxID=1121307 RepID=A0A0J8DEB1_CLOCY|nr:hypothetical protein [Clostridium cylindrosporum]KMT22564.1 putative HD-superfamily hydrolase [Clostridium cylindrosporum DSM 605]
MKINEIKEIEDGSLLNIIGLITNKDVVRENDDNPYILFTIQDATGNITFPVCNSFEYNNQSFNIGDIVNVEGTKRDHRNKIELTNVDLSKSRDNIDINILAPSYNAPNEVTGYFIDKINSLEEKYKKIAIAATGAFGSNEKRWNDFITYSFFDKNNGDTKKGLIAHTVGVLKAIDSIIENYINTPLFKNSNDSINKDRLLLCAIIDAIMKVKKYEYDTVISRKETLLDFEVIGANYIDDINKESGNPLADDELQIIKYSTLYYNGPSGDNEAKTIEDVLLNCSDEIVGKVESITC